jgi:hypothetical protein
MTARTVLTTDTLETFRTTFNSLSQTDIGDPASLTTTATNIVAAINEVNASVTTAFKIADDTSTQQTINSGDVFRISSDANTTATITSPDTLTIGLASTISGLTSVSATTLTDGIMSINSGSLTSVVNITGSGTANFTTDVQVNGVSVATNAFAIAQAVALG